MPCRRKLGLQLVDLLVLALRADEHPPPAALPVCAWPISPASKVRPAQPRQHRAPRNRPRLRHVHPLSARAVPRHQTVGSWVRDQRLEACREALSDTANTVTVAEIAYRWGFQRPGAVLAELQSPFRFLTQGLQAQARNKAAPKRRFSAVTRPTSPPQEARHRVPPSMLRQAGRAEARRQSPFHAGKSASRRCPVRRSNLARRHEGDYLHGRAAKALVTEDSHYRCGEQKPTR